MSEASCYASSEPQGQERVNNSEIFYHQLKALGANRTGALLKIKRNRMQNDQTRDTIFMTDRAGGKFGQVVTLTPDDGGDFWAVVGTPNGRAAGWLVAQRGRKFGVTRIVSIEIEVEKGLPSMTINLAPADDTVSLSDDLRTSPQRTDSLFSPQVTRRIDRADQRKPLLTTTSIPVAQEPEPDCCGCTLF
jgi:hypothetical protein